MKNKLYEICEKMFHNSWAYQAEHQAAVKWLKNLKAALEKFEPGMSKIVDDLSDKYIAEMEVEGLKAHEARERAKADKYMMDHPEEYEFYNEFLGDDEMKGLYFSENFEDFDFTENPGNVTIIEEGK